MRRAESNSSEGEVGGKGCIDHNAEIPIIGVKLEYRLYGWQNVEYFGMSVLPFATAFQIQVR